MLADSRFRWRSGSSLSSSSYTVARTKTRLLRLLTPLLLLASACSESGGPLGPEALKQTFAGGARVVTLSDNGQSYTLDVDSRELRDQDGRIVELTAAQVGQFASLYDEALYTDYLIGEFEDEGMPEQEMCGPNPCYEELNTSLLAEALAAGSQRRPFGDLPAQRWVVADGRIVVHRQIRPLTHGVPRFTPFGVLASVEVPVEVGPGSDSYEDPPSCWDIAMAIYSLRSEMPSRSGLLVSTIGTLFSALSFELDGFKLKAVMPDAFWSAVGLEVVAAEQLTRSFALQFLAVQYSGYACWTRDWDNRGDFEGVVSYESNSSIEESCEFEWIALELEGETHWYNAEVCTLEWVE